MDAKKRTTQLISGSLFIGEKNSALTNMVLCAACLAPIIGLWVYKCLIFPRPFWVRMYDPEAAYFMNSLLLVAGNSPWHIDHPGTPVQMIGALIAYVGNIGLFDIQKFLTIGYFVSMIFTIFAFTVFFFSILRKLHSDLKIGAALLLWCIPNSLSYLNIWSPDAFALGTQCIILICLWLAVWHDERLWIWVSTGATVGFACGLKILFLPWMTGLLAISWVWKQPRNLGVRLKAAFSVLVGGIIGFLLGTFPILPQYPRFFDWIYQITLHNGQYGRGDRGFPSSAELFSRAIQFINNAKGWHFLFGICFCAAIIGVVRKYRQKEPDRMGWTALFIGSLITFIIGWSLIMRTSAPDYHYLLPSGGTIVVLYIISSHIWLQNIDYKKRLIFLGIICLILGKAIIQDVQSHNKLVTEANYSNEKLEKYFKAHYPLDEKPTVIFGGRPPRPSYAFRIGDSYTNQKFKSELDRAFPLEGMLLPEGYIMVPNPEIDHWDFLCWTQDWAQPPLVKSFEQIGMYRILKNPIVIKTRNNMLQVLYGPQG